MKVSVCAECYHKKNKLVKGKLINTVRVLNNTAKSYKMYQCPDCMDTYKE